MQEIVCVRTCAYVCVLHSISDSRQHGPGSSSPDPGVCTACSQESPALNTGSQRGRLVVMASAGNRGGSQAAASLRPSLLLLPPSGRRHMPLYSVGRKQAAIFWNSCFGVRRLLNLNLPPCLRHRGANSVTAACTSRQGFNLTEGKVFAP